MELENFSVLEGIMKRQRYSAPGVLVCVKELFFVTAYLSSVLLPRPTWKRPQSRSYALGGIILVMAIRAFFSPHRVLTASPKLPGPPSPTMCDCHDSVWCQCPSNPSNKLPSAKNSKCDRRCGALTTLQLKHCRSSMLIGHLVGNVATTTLPPPSRGNLLVLLTHSWAV